MGCSRAGAYRRTLGVVACTFWTRLLAADAFSLTLRRCTPGPSLSKILFGEGPDIACERTWRCQTCRFCAHRWGRSGSAAWRARRAPVTCGSEWPLCHSIAGGHTSVPRAQSPPSSRRGRSPECPKRCAPSSGEHYGHRLCSAPHCTRGAAFGYPFCPGCAAAGGVRHALAYLLAVPQCPGGFKPERGGRCLADIRELQWIRE